MSNTGSSPIVPTPTTANRFLPSAGSARMSTSASGFTTLDRELIRRELERTLLYFIDCNFPCVLEGFGIIFPLERKIQRVSNDHHDHFVLTVETERSIDFEKTDEICQSHYLQFPKLLDERDISDRIYDKIHTQLSSTCSEFEMRKALKKVIASIKEETVEHGYSEALIGLGIFVAHHNRQGQSPRDWYAGCDIFFDKPWTKTVKIESSARLTMPILENAHEPFEMFYGAPRSIKTFEVKNELEALGYEIPPEISQGFLIKVGAFLNDSTRGKKIVSFVSDGMRNLRSSNSKGSASTGSEIVLQMPIAEVDAVALDDTCELDVSKFPSFLGQIFALSALLMCYSKNKQVPHGVGVALAADRDENKQLGDTTTLVAFPFLRLGQKQLDTGGNFYYSAITLITPDEAALIEGGQKYLLTLFLKRKGYDQVVSTRRKSVYRQTVSNKTAVVKKPQIPAINP